MAFCSAIVAASSGSMFSSASTHAVQARCSSASAWAERPAAMDSAPSTLSRSGPGAKAAISVRCCAALAASPFCSIQVTASRSRRCRSAGVGLCRAASTSARRRRGPRLPAGFVLREGLQIGRELLVGQDRRGDAVPQGGRRVPDERGRGRVQGAAARHAERIMHGRPHEGVRERHRERRARRRLGQQPRPGRLVERERADRPARPTPPPAGAGCASRGPTPHPRTCGPPSSTPTSGRAPAAGTSAARAVGSGPRSTPAAGTR